MKAALFVSKFLKSKELAHLNGVGEVVLENPRNIAFPFLTLSTLKHMPPVKKQKRSFHLSQNDFL